MSNELRPILQSLYHEAAGRAYDYQASLRRNHVSWIVHKDGWFAPRICSVTEYAPGCIRFRNDSDVEIPKRIWPLGAPRLEHTGKMEITIHAGEIESLMPLIVEITEDATRDYQNAAFPNGIVTPHYCWSIRASEHYKSQQKPAKPLRV